MPARTSKKSKSTSAYRMQINVHNSSPPADEQMVRQGLLSTAFNPIMNTP